MPRLFLLPLAGMLRRAIQSILPSSQPWITRQSYRFELRHALTFTFAAALMEGTVVGVLARKTFDVSPLLFATIMAAPMFANVTSFVWAHLARGRRKVRFINVLQVAMLGCVVAIALLPMDSTGAAMLTALIVVTRCLQSGIITIRSTLWRMNYPRAVRAQVTSKLVLVNSMLIAVVPVLGYLVVDWHPDAFRLIYPASAVVSLFGVAALNRIRMRGERSLLKFEMTPGVEPQPHGTPSPIYEYDPNQTTPTFWSVLRQDKLYRGYMFCQFILGCATMSSEVVLVYYIAELTDGLSYEYLKSILLTTAIPAVLALFTMGAWARYFDRIHVIRFRVRMGAFWFAYQFATLAGALAGSLLWIALGRVFLGLARGGAVLAWTLGHNDFANRRAVAQYMGIHVTLTGVRGAIAPFVGMALYEGWQQRSILFTDWALPAFKGLGPHLWLVTLALLAVSQVGFMLMSRSLPKKTVAD